MNGYDNNFPYSCSNSKRSIFKKIINARSAADIRILGLKPEVKKEEVF
jgi:hypothetical protein